MMERNNTQSASYEEVSSEIHLARPVEVCCGINESLTRWREKTNIQWKSPTKLVSVVFRQTLSVGCCNGTIS